MQNERNHERSNDPYGGLVQAVDKFITMKAAADTLGLPYHKIQRAAAKGLIPSYSLGDSRKYVRLREILSRLEHKTP